jgi:hypothetical protein
MDEAFRAELIQHGKDHATDLLKIERKISLHLHNQNHVSSHFIRSTLRQRGVHGRGVREYVWRNRFRRIN